MSDKRLLGFYQIYNLSAVSDKDETIRFWGQKIKGHSDTIYGQKSLVQKRTFLAKVFGGTLNLAECSIYLSILMGLKSNS